MFQIKMGLLATSIIVTLILQWIIWRQDATWEREGRVSLGGVGLVAVTALLWAAVTVGGRLTAYLGTLYPS